MSAAFPVVADAFDGKDDFSAALLGVFPLLTDLESEYGFEDPGEAAYASDSFFLGCGTGDIEVFHAVEDAMSEAFDG